MATDLRRTALSEEEKRKEVEAKKCREKRNVKARKGDRESGEGNVDREKSGEYRGEKLEEGDLRRKNKESK